MFSIRQKQKIADEIQKIIRATNHPELPDGEIEFEIHIKGKEDWSWADIKNNGSWDGSVSNHIAFIHNEMNDKND